MKRSLLAIGLALIVGGMAHAKTPKEVLEPYKSYRAALAEKNKDEAAVFAFEAWQKAEKLMGCLLYTSPSPRDLSTSRMPSSA